MATLFAGPIPIPLELKDILEQHKLSDSLIQRMSVEDWLDFEKRCDQKVPYGLLLQVRYAIADKMKEVEEELARCEVRRDKAVLDKVRKTVGKLFHGEEGVGTIIFVAAAVGLCAFHSIHTKKNHTILEDSLSVNGYGVKFMAGYPSFDIALYKIVDADGNDRDGPFVELESDTYMFEGSPISLLSFPAFDSVSRDDEEDDPMFIHGSISRLQLEKDSLLAVGHYSSFPNSSGGAVISKRGKLLGVHVEGIYHEDHEHFRPPSSPPVPEGPIHPPLPPNGEPIPALKLAATVKGEEQEEAHNEEETKDVEQAQEATKQGETKDSDLLQFAISNLRHKDSLAAFVPVYHLRQILQNEKVIANTKCGHTKGKRARRNY